MSECVFVCTSVRVHVFVTNEDMHLYYDTGITRCVCVYVCVSECVCVCVCVCVCE